MARKKSTTKTNKTRNTKATTARRAAIVSTPVETPSQNRLINRVQGDLENKNAILNLILGALIILVGAVLIFNYLNKPNANVGPAQETAIPSPSVGDVAKENLPGNYTVKEGDTLFSIAQNYYDDGYKYPEIMKANQLTNESIVVDQIINIPNLANPSASPMTDNQSSPSAIASATTAISPTAAPAIEPNPTTAPQTQAPESASGAVQSVWGEKIAGDTYTVQQGDWLSTISARAYGGDIYSYQKIAQANGITNPDIIEPGTVLKIPR